MLDGRAGPSCSQIAGLRLEQFAFPAPSAPKVDLAMVQPMGAIRPELDCIRLHAKSTPVGWARNVAASKLSGELLAPLNEFCP